MAKKNSIDLESLYCGILFCISLIALILACLAYTKKNPGGEYYKTCGGAPSTTEEEEEKKLKKLLKSNN